MLFNVYTELFLFLELMHRILQHSASHRAQRVLLFYCHVIFQLRELQLSTAQDRPLGVCQMRRRSKEDLGNVLFHVSTFTFSFTWDQAMVKPRPYVQFLTMSAVTFSHKGALFPGGTGLQVHRSLSSPAPWDTSLPLSLKLQILIGAF